MIIDISSNNGIIDWKEVKNQGVTDVIIRLSLGYNTLDASAQAYALGAAAVGIRINYYHFAYPDTKTGGTILSDSKAEATYFASLFSKGQLPAPIGLAVDLEYWKDKPRVDSPLTDPDDYYSWISNFMQVLKGLTGLDCYIYSTKSYLDSHLPEDHDLGKYPLWVSDPNGLPNPRIPNGWLTYDLWQYDIKPIKGIQNLVDINRLK
jgi:lysozyme